MGPGAIPVAEPFPAEGLPLEEARRRVLRDLSPLPGEERLRLRSCLGRVSSREAHAAEDIPGFRASILDGYAIADSDPPPEGSCWRVVGRSAPGSPHAGSLRQGQAVRILTGAPLPPEGLRVLPQELVDLEHGASAPGSGRLRLCGSAGDQTWIRPADEEARAGDPILQAGVHLGPADLARLASCGVTEVWVRARPRLGLLISGDELVPAGSPRGAGQIWESNGLLLAALLARLGHDVAEQRVVADEPAELRTAMQDLASRCDLVVSTGGVSVGDSDWIRPLLGELGAVEFWKLFLKPGRPFAFGTLAGRPFFGLPGNPVAAAVVALQLLWPALQRLEGAPPQTFPRIPVRLANALRRRSGRPELARARLDVGVDGQAMARVDGRQASSRIGSLQGADLLLEIPAELGDLEVGHPLWAQILRVPLL